MLAGNLRCRSNQGDPVLTYWAKIPALASNSTNWLLTDHPNLYLFQSLYFAALFQRDGQAMQDFERMAETEYGYVSADYSTRFGPMALRAG